MKQLAIVSGGFDPVHPGHIALFAEAVEKYGEVLVILNSDRWLTKKKGQPFMTWEDRAAVLRAIRGVRDVVSVDDGDGTVCNALSRLHRTYWDHTLTFCNGGDRLTGNTPEAALCEGLGIQLAWNVGGSKMNSSSILLSQWLETNT